MVYAYFSYQAGSWDRKRRVVSIVEWHSGELDTCVGFIVTNLEAKSVIKWTRTFAANAARLQLHALASALGNFLCNPATPAPISDWSLSSLRRSSSRSVPRSSTTAARSPSKWLKSLFRDNFSRHPALIAELRTPAIAEAE